MKIVYEIVALYVYNCPNILQDGILKNRSTYEILSPEDVGIVKSENSGIVLGKLSGRHAVKDRLKELGYEISDEKFNDIFSRYRELTKDKKRITDADLKALVVNGAEISSEKLNSKGINDLMSSPQISAVV
jgi:isopropylmalate/homocitrate/citramalate synthase